MDELTSKVNQIPHLDLGKRFDVGMMLNEVDKIDEFYAYQSKYPGAAKMYARNWSGVSLLSYDGNHATGMAEIETAQGIGLKKTPIGEICPYLCSIAKELSADGNRVRVMRIAPTGTLAWHSHVKKMSQPLTTITVHVPIVVPELFRWSVIDVNDYKGVNTPVENIHSLRYEPGSAVAFNSYHYHNVFNDDPLQYRVSLMLYSSLTAPGVRDIFQDAVNNYRGPLLSAPDHVN